MIVQSVLHATAPMPHPKVAQVAPLAITLPSHCSPLSRMPLPQKGVETGVGAVEVGVGDDGTNVPPGREPSQRKKKSTSVPLSSAGKQRCCALSTLRRQIRLRDTQGDMQSPLA